MLVKSLRKEPEVMTIIIEVIRPLGRTDIACFCSVGLIVTAATVSIIRNSLSSIMNFASMSRKKVERDIPEQITKPLRLAPHTPRSAKLSPVKQRGYDEPMSAGLSAFREAYARSRNALRDEFMVNRDAASTLSSLTAAADDLIRNVCQLHDGRRLFALLAIGGYGRRELYPHSDVDLLFVFKESLKAEAEKAITATLHNLWDSKLHLGHQVWGLDELETLEAHEFEFVLALLDGRVIAGDETLGYGVLHGILPELLTRESDEVTARIVEATRARHASYRDTIYQLEPDIKLAPGGLRDYLTAKWLASLGRDPVGFLPYSQSEIEAAHGAMARLRIWLHFLRGRQQNQLTHKMQEEVARALGYSETGLQAGVESLMAEYFLNARVINSFCRKMIGGIPGPETSTAEFDLPDHQALESFDAILRVFHRSMVQSRRLSDQARQRIVQALPVASQTLSYPEVCPLVRDLLRPRSGLYRMLTEMYEMGVLEILFPEFGSIKARVVRDFYHKYTVDEHSLLAVKSIEDLIETRENSDLRFRSLLMESQDADLLSMALLLHDIGKSREGAHVQRSTSMAAKALRRLRLGREEFETVLFLIRNHLAMSSVVFRRDLDDPAVISRFVDLVNDPGRLRLLCLMTYGDIKAVAPGTLNDWKKDLLFQLYVSAYNKLTLGYGEERIEEEDVSEQLLLDLPGEFEVDKFESFLEGLPRRYVMTVEPAEIYEHFRLASRLSSKDGVQLRLTERRDYYELCTVTPDRSYLFAKIVGLLSYFEMNILRGYGFSNKQNTVLDLFHFHDTRKVFTLNPEEKSRFLDLLEKSVREQFSIEKLVAGKENSVVFRRSGPLFAPTIHFDDEYSDRYSIMEIVAPDSIGLLYRIGREIAELHCNIELVLINTEGNKAVDVFYLTFQGKKLPPELERRLEERIIAAVGAEP
jgi:[protein-PII] uridylyltransferase